MSLTRKQLTIFIHNQSIEKIRAKFNPVQYDLIAAHVTLCREDELNDLSRVIAKIKAITIESPIQINFDKVQRFDHQKGVFLPANANNNDFHHLRASILENPRNHLPHITLMHPRNAICTDAIFEEIQSHKLPEFINFNKVSLIEQKPGGKWIILEDFLLQK